MRKQKYEDNKSYHWTKQYEINGRVLLINATLGPTIKSIADAHRSSFPESFNPWEKIWANVDIASLLTSPLPTPLPKPRSLFRRLLNLLGLDYAQ